MAPPFFLTTLGLPELRGPDGNVVRFRVRKHLALLVYLAVERRRGHDRSRLVQLFWPPLTGAPGGGGRPWRSTGCSAGSIWTTRPSSAGGRTGSMLGGCRRFTPGS